MIEALIALGSTVIGTVLGWVLAKVQTGKLYVTLDNTKEEPHYVEPEIMSIPGKQANELYYMEFTFTIQLYNARQQNMAIRDCRLHFTDKSGHEIMCEQALDEATRRRYGGGTKCDSIDVFNIPAQTSANINAVLYIFDIDSFYLTNAIKFSYKTERLKTVFLPYKEIQTAEIPRFNKEANHNG